MAGFNCQTRTTISDLGGAISWLWTYPGDWVLRLPQVNKVFELDALHTGGWISGLLPVAAYFFLLFFLFLLAMVTDK